MNKKGGLGEFKSMDNPHKHSVYYQNMSQSLIVRDLEENWPMFKEKVHLWTTVKVSFTLTLNPQQTLTIIPIHLTAILFPQPTGSLVWIIRFIRVKRMK